MLEAKELCISKLIDEKNSDQSMVRVQSVETLGFTWIYLEIVTWIFRVLKL